MNNQLIEKAIKITGSQLELASRSGVSQSAIHKLLTRKSKDMRIETAKKLANATGINLSEFFD
jgi:transcriptional regulator with XRE-family HTH domain